MYVDKKELLLTNSNEFIPQYPSLIFRQYGGAIFTPQRFDRLLFYIKEIYYLGRIDSICQSYCDIGNLPVILLKEGGNKYSNYNLL